MTDPLHSPVALDEVHRLLGECLLSLQRFECLLKRLLIDHQRVEPAMPRAPEADPAAERLRAMTLGQLASVLFETFCVADGTASGQIPSAAPEVKHPTATTWVGVEMPAEFRDSTRSAVRDLVAMRNELVHHLVERFNLGCATGRGMASEHLRSCLAQIEQHHRMLKQWAQGAEAVREVARTSLQSEAFADWVMNGIWPDGTHDPAENGAVWMLREAAQVVSDRGWARLDRALDWIAEHSPEQTPRKYGCRSWPQLMDASRKFELTYRPGPDGRWVAWYRERPDR